jgi:hypothetical protein
MFRESNFDAFTPGIAVREGALRHPDGSIDFDAYRERARCARRAAIASSIRSAFSLIARVRRQAGAGCPASSN